MRAQIGTPEYLDVLVLQLLEGAGAVEHHNDIVTCYAATELPPGRNVDRLADAVEHNLVPRRQNLDARNARDDLKLELHGAHRCDAMEKPERAVIKRRVAPDQKRSAF